MSKAVQVILDLLIDELKDTAPEIQNVGGMVYKKFKSQLADVKFDTNARLIVFKISNGHHWTYNESKRFNDLKERIAEHLRDRGLDAMVVFINEDIEVQMLSDNDLRKMGLQRIPEYER